MSGRILNTLEKHDVRKGGTASTSW